MNRDSKIRQAVRFKRPQPTDGAKAFTFVEFIIVILVIMTLMTLMSGIANAIMENAARQRTTATMKTILSAIDAYIANTKSMPADKDSPNGPDSLLKQLKSCDAARKKIDALPSDARSNDAILDGWGSNIQYDSSGPVNPKTGKAIPLLISPGPDGNYQTEEDNIRSDIHIAD